VISLAATSFFTG